MLRFLMGELREREIKRRNTSGRQMKDKRKTRERQTKSDLVFIHGDHY